MRPDAQPERDSRRLSALLAGELRLGWSPPVLRRIAAIFGVAVDYLPGLPAVVYLREGEGASQRRQWRVGPRLMLGLELRP